MNIPSIVGRLTNFVLFLVFRHRFVKEFLCWFSWGLLILLMRKSLRWVDFKGLFSLCFARHSKWLLILGVLSDTIWSGTLSLLHVLIGLYFSQNFEEEILIFHFVRSPPWPKPLPSPPPPPRPYSRFQVILNDAICDTLTTLQSASRGETFWLIINLHYESYLRSNIFFILVLVLLSTVYRLLA